MLWKIVSLEQLFDPHWIPNICANSKLLLENHLCHWRLFRAKFERSADERWARTDTWKWSDYNLTIILLPAVINCCSTRQSWLLKISAKSVEPENDFIKSYFTTYSFFSQLFLITFSNLQLRKEKNYQNSSLHSFISMHSSVFFSNLSDLCTPRKIWLML